MPIFIHIPRTAGTAICQCFGLVNAHEWARARKGSVSPEVWESDYKFTVVRNPWAQAVSFYTLHAQMQPYKGSFREWILQGMPTHWPVDPMDQLAFFTDEDGGDMVNSIFRFESLAQDMPQLCERLGVPNCSLPVVNGRARTWDYRPHYDRHTRNIIAKRYPAFVERFGYQY